MRTYRKITKPSRKRWIHGVEPKAYYAEERKEIELQKKIAILETQTYGIEFHGVRTNEN